MCTILIILQKSKRFSKETVVALITNIEGREWHRREVARSIKPDHPRVSSTDDVECFFSMMHDSLGRNFNSKQVQFGIRKVYGKFIKRLDLDLPFYFQVIHVFMKGHYQTSTNHL